MPEPYLVFKGKDGGLMKLTDKGIEPADHLPGALKASLEDILSRKGLKDQEGARKGMVLVISDKDIIKDNDALGRVLKGFFRTVNKAAGTDSMTSSLVIFPGIR